MWFITLKMIYLHRVTDDVIASHKHLFSVKTSISKYGDLIERWSDMQAGHVSLRSLLLDVPYINQHPQDGAVVLFSKGGLTRSRDIPYINTLNAINAKKKIHIKDGKSEVRHFCSRSVDGVW